MTDKDRCGPVTSLLAMSCRGKADAFVRSLHVKLRSLNVDEDDDDEVSSSWHTNGNGQQSNDFESPLLSPEDERENPLFNGTIVGNYNPDGLTQIEDIQCTNCGDCSNIVPNSIVSSCNGDGLNGESTFLPLSTVVANSVENHPESCSSMDEMYETASDHSADDEDTSWNTGPFPSKKQEESTEPPIPPILIEQNHAEISLVVSSEDESNKDTCSTFYQSETSPDESFENETIPKIRRCSSLKSGKTPPGTPGSKKIVRFADALGLDLADVKTFVDDIPKIPTSAYFDLRNLEDENDELILMKSRTNNKPEKTLIPLFQQPGGQPDFLDVIRNNFVSLENALVEDAVSCAIRGMVRVRNVDFHKSVFVRYSIDSWKSYVDVQASYVENSCDGFSDKFSFLLYANMLGPGQGLEFAVVFQARGEQFWDNNKGVNYCFQCISTHAPTLAPLTHVLPSAWEDDHWGASFY